MNNHYFFTFSIAMLLSLLATPVARAVAVWLRILDRPHTDIKTHKEPVPYLGGAAIFLAFVLSLIIIRQWTSFPSGTLRNLRGLVMGGGLVFLLGLIDDIKPGGLHYRTKFPYQMAGAAMAMLFGMHINFIQPIWLGSFITLFWIVGVSNAFNLIDIMDGLASTVATVASVAFLLISFPTEAVYVNFGAAALAGAAIGFLPYNTSKKMRIFMGDAGSLFLGFVCSALALGASYGNKSPLTVLAPLLILALPIYDTLLVSYLRLRKGMSPFMGSKDHYCLRLEMLGWKRPEIVVFSGAVTAICGLGAYCVTRYGELWVSLSVFGCAALGFAVLTSYLLRVKVK